MAGFGGPKSQSGPGYSCYNCNRPGHFARECPNPRQQQERCRNCGNIGHSVSQCSLNFDGPDPNARRFNGDGGRRPNGLGRGARGRGSGPAQSQGPHQSGPGAPGHSRRYVPQGMREEDLYHTGIAPGPAMEELLNADVETQQTQTSDATRNSRITEFAQISLHPTIQHNLTLSGYRRPTPIQSTCMPAIMDGKDVMATAPTGCGKTLAYVLPIINRIVTFGEAAMSERAPDVATAETSQCAMPLCIVFVPSRELCLQTNEQVLKIIKGLTVRSIAMYGGTDMEYATREAVSNPTVVVSCLGRAEHMIRHGRLSLKRVKYLVLDEADVMLAQDREPIIRSLVQQMPNREDRQTVMMSATFEQDVQKLANDFLREKTDQFVFVKVGAHIGQVPSSIRQTVELVPYSNKTERLVDWATAEMANVEQTKEERKSDRGAKEVRYSRKTLIFAERKRSVDFYTAVLIRCNLPALSIHGDREQSQREFALRKLREGEIVFLVATGVMERGMDITGVDNVLNVDLPHTIEQYVHRVGRTGRLGNAGSAHSFYDPGVDTPLAEQLVQCFRQCQQPVPSFLSLYDTHNAMAGLNLGQPRQQQQQPEPNAAAPEATQPVEEDLLEWN